MKTENKRLIVVLGMHRSGTSAITKALELLGVRLGDNLHPAGIDNPKGFWEDEECIQINEALLNHLGSAYDRLDFAWDEIKLDDTVIELKQKAVQLVSLRLLENDGIWGFKDPRVCRLLAFWNEVFLEARCEVSFVIQVRNPASVVASLATRNSINQIRSYYLWLQHVLPAMTFTKGAPRIVVDYDELLANPYLQLTRISSKLRLPLPAHESPLVKDYENSFLDSELRHTNYKEDDLARDGRASKMVSDSYNLLHRLAEDSESPENPIVQEKINKLDKHLKELSPAFAYINNLEDSLTGSLSQITNLNQTLSMRDSAIEEQTKAIDEQAKAIDEQAKVIDKIYASISWSLTRPLRFFNQLILNPKGLLRHLNKLSSAMNKIKYLLYILYSFKNHENRKNFVVKLREYLDGITTQPQLISTPSEQPQLISTPYNIDVLGLAINHKILLVVHQFSRTGAPHAVLYLARALFSIHGIRPVVISPIDGPIREEFEQEGFPTVVDPLLFSYQNYSSEACDFVASFEKVIVTSLASFNFIRYFRGIAKRQTWWIHETEVGFTSVASMATDLPLLFAVCESIWLGSTLCFPLALKYAPKGKLHLLLYGCADTAFPYQPNKSGKVIFSIIGSVEPRKGQDIFLEAIGLLPAALRCKAVFRIIGSPLPFEASEVFYKKICASARRISEVECIPNMPLEELQKYYSETDVIVSASKDDPMPIVITQGLMFSKVCVCSSAIGHAQLLEDEKDGLVFSNESAEDLAEKITWILQNPGQLNSLGVAGRAIYEKHFLMTSFIHNVSKLMPQSDK